MTITLRFATPDDAAAISALIVDLQPFLTIAPDGAGAEQFMASIQPEVIAANVRAENYRYQLAHEGATLAGVVAVRDNTHLFNLYVAREFHGQGLGRRLWQAARDDAIQRGNRGSFTVNSSAYAEQVYRRWGFAPAAPAQELHGLRFIPMRLAADGDQREL
jgi:GNAT superfamily N-acetyltransferase